MPSISLQSVWVLIPALNEAESIACVLGDLPAVGRVIVVDNGSTDETAERAVAAGADVVHEQEKGYGAACLRGMAEVRHCVAAGEPAPEVIVFADADYSDHIHTLSELVAPITRGDADFVLGSRLLGTREPGAMPPQSLYGNRFACWLMRHLFGTSYTDLGPFRAISWEALENLGMVDRNFGWTIEMQIKAAKQGLRTLEVPTDYRNRIGASKISGTVNGTIRAGSKILYTVAKYGVKR
ncbi:MAG: glycosyltransferase family 2 protein [Planctomycetota bacterium]